MKKELKTFLFNSKWRQIAQFFTLVLKEHLINRGNNFKHEALHITKLANKIIKDSSKDLHKNQERFIQNRQIALQDQKQIQISKGIDLKDV